MAQIDHVPMAGNFKMPPISAAVRMGNLLFVSGTPGYHDDGRIDEEFGAQFVQAVATLRMVLGAGGASMHSIIKVNMLLTRREDLDEMNRRYTDAFGPAPYPARTTCFVAGLPDPRMLLEIECVAAVNEPAGEADAN